MCLCHYSLFPCELMSPITPFFNPFYFSVNLFLSLFFFVYLRQSSLLHNVPVSFIYINNVFPIYLSVSMSFFFMYLCPLYLYTHVIPIYLSVSMPFLSVYVSQCLSHLYVLRKYSQILFYSHLSTIHHSLSP